MPTVDLRDTDIRELNRRLHAVVPGDNREPWKVTHPKGGHALAVGLEVAVDIEIDGHVGYYCGGMNTEARLEIAGNAGPGLGENMMSGEIHVRGNASQYCGATSHGGLLVINGDAAARCGISMKGIDLVVGGSIGHMSAFMAQSGRMVVCGDAGDALGDSIYEARLYVQGKVTGLGADCIEKSMDAEHLDELGQLLDRAGLNHDPKNFRRYGSARKLYNFQVDNVGAY